MPFDERDGRQEEVVGVTSSEELVKAFEAEGVELTDAQLEKISGGGIWGSSSGGNNGIGVKCPYCGSSDVRVEYWEEGWDQCVLRCYGCRAGWIGPLPPD